MSEAGSHNRFDERSAGLMPQLNGFGILGRVGIFQGPPSCQPETAARKRGRVSERNPEPETLTPNPNSQILKQCFL